MPLTSLMNVVQYTLFAAQRLFPLFEVVETPSDATRESFLLAVISGIVSTMRDVFAEADLAADCAF